MKAVLKVMAAAGLGKDRNLVLIFLGLVFLGIVLIRNAWLCEDSYITFRVVDNFVNGHGLRWNVLDRVQTYTNPLWLFVVAAFHFFTNELYFTVVFLTTAISLAGAAVILLGFARGTVGALLVLAAMVGSKAFIDFATSGMENPLAHLLLLAFGWLVVRVAKGQRTSAREVLAPSLLAALAMVNRMDHGLLFAPALVWLVLRRPFLPRLKWAAVGTLPFLAWEAFAIVYYGFPFPNTAYAKLAAGLWASELWEQGFFYLVNSVTWDPLTLFVVAAAAVKTAVQRKIEDVVLMLGASAYLFYVVSIGGDHMSGRFLTVIFVVSLAVLARMDFDRIWHGVAALAMIVVLGAMSVSPPVTSGEDHERRVVDGNGIADERGFFYQGCGFLKISKRNPFRKSMWAVEGLAERKKGRHVVEREMMGWYGYYAGPAVHIVDPLALSDPLLARLPKRLGNWRVAHYFRETPRGYLASVFEENEIEDEALAEYWDRLKVVTRGPLFGAERWREIWRFNTGGYDRLIAAYCERSCSVFDHASVSRLNAGDEWRSRKNLYLNEHGLGIRNPGGARAARRIVLILSEGSFELRYYKDGSAVGRQRVRAAGADPGHMEQVEVHVDGDAARAGFDLVRLYPEPRNARRTFGGIRVEGWK